MSQAFLETLAEPASHPHLGAATQHRDVVAMGILAQLGHQVDVDHGRAVDADELPRVERHFERPDQRAMQVGAVLARMDAHVHPLRLDPADVLHRKQPDAMRAFEDDLVHRGAGAIGAAGCAGASRLAEQRLHLGKQSLGASGADAPNGPVEGRLEAFVAERLQQVVHGVRLERAHGERVVGRHEDHRGHLDTGIGDEPGQHAEPIKLRHLHVEAQHLDGRARGRRRAHHRQSFGAPSATPGDLDTFVSRQQPAHALAGRLLVVDDEHAHLRHVCPPCDGMVIVTSNPRSGRGWTLSRSRRP